MADNMDFAFYRNVEMALRKFHMKRKGIFVSGTVPTKQGSGGDADLPSDDEKHSSLEMRDSSSIVMMPAGPSEAIYDQV